MRTASGTGGTAPLTGGTTALELEALYAHPAGVLRANFVVSLDGAVELDGHSGPLGGPTDRELLATLRALCDVVLVGAGTARREGYGPAWLEAGRRERRRDRGQPPLPTLAVVSDTAELDPGARMFSERRTDQPSPPRVVVLTSGAAPDERRRGLGEVADVVVCGDEHVDLRQALDALGARSTRVLCEGGPRLLAGLVREGLLDELCLTHAPVLAGGGRTHLIGEPWPEGVAPARFRAASVLPADGMLLARWVLERSSP